MNFLELTLKTIENQIQIIRELVKKDSSACVSTGVTAETTVEPSYALLHQFATLRLKEEELDQMRCENERLRSTIENLVLNTVPNSELDPVQSSQLDLEFQRGFNEGVKSAQQEQVITGLNLAEMDDTPEQEYLGQLENDVQEAEAEATPVPVPELVTENNVESVNTTTETHAQNMKKEEVTEEVTEEDDEEELVEVEFNGKTYYYHEESGQIFTTDEAGEVDINVPVGRWSNKKQQFVLFRQ